MRQRLSHLRRMQDRAHNVKAAIRHFGSPHCLDSIVFWLSLMVLMHLFGYYYHREIYMKLNHDQSGASKLLLVTYNKCIYRKILDVIIWITQPGDSFVPNLKKRSELLDVVLIIWITLLRDSCVLNITNLLDTRCGVEIMSYSTWRY